MHCFSFVCMCVRMCICLHRPTTTCLSVQYQPFMSHKDPDRTSDGHTFTFETCYGLLLVLPQGFSHTVGVTTGLAASLVGTFDTRPSTRSPIYSWVDWSSVGKFSCSIRQSTSATEYIWILNFNYNYKFCALATWLCCCTKYIIKLVSLK